MPRERQQPLKVGRERSVRSVQRLTAIAEVNDVFASLARMLKRRIRSSWTVVYLLDRHGHGFAPARTFGLPETLQPVLRQMPLLPGREAEQRRLLGRRRQLLLADPASATMLAPACRELLAPLTLIAVPLRIRQQLQGLVLLARPRRLPLLTAAELAGVRELVDQAALVASQIRLSEESLDLSIDMAKRIDTILTLDEINKAISSSLSHERIIATAADRIEELIRCDLQVIAELRGNVLQVVAVRYGNGNMPPALEPGKQLADQGFIHQALAGAGLYHITDTDREQQTCRLLQELRNRGIRSLLAAPLLTSQGARGLLLLGDRQAGGFPEDALFAGEKIASQLAVALENARLYEEMRQLFFNTVASLANAIDAKSPWTKGHSERVMNVAANIARELGLDEAAVERVRLCGLLHDIGKIGVMEALLEKPAELDEDEFPPIRLHPEKGVAILAPISQLQEVLPGILHHHEFYDGNGYPAGLAGEAIPLDARIIAVADSFDAMVADRPYRKGLAVDAAAGELARCAGTQFDPEIVDCFCSRLAHLLGKPAVTMPHSAG